MRQIQLMTAEARADAALMSAGELCLRYAGLPFVSHRHETQAFYIRMRISGQTHALAEMLALRKFPGVKGTSSVFMQGTHHQDTQYDHMRYIAAQQNGVDTNGKRYLSSLARFPNDPEAWVSGIDDVARVVRDRGWNCSGAVDHTGFDPSKHERPADTAIAPDLVRDHVEDRLSAFDSGEIDTKLRRDVEEYVTQELSGQIDLTPEPKVSAYEDPFSLPGMEPD